MTNWDTDPFSTSKWPSESQFCERYLCRQSLDTRYGGNLEKINIMKLEGLIVFLSEISVKRPIEVLVCSLFKLLPSMLVMKIAWMNFFSSNSLVYFKDTIFFVLNIRDIDFVLIYEPNQDIRSNVHLQLQRTATISWVKRKGLWCKMHFFLP